MFAETAPLRAQIGGLSLLLLSICAFLLAAHRLPDLSWLQWTMFAFLVVGAIHVWVRLIPGGVAVSTALLGQDQLGSMFWVWFAALAFGQAVFNRDLPRGWRFALAASVTACLCVGVSNKEWTSGWLPAVVAVVVTLLVGAPRFAPIILLGGGGLAVGLLPRVLAFIIGDTNQYSISTRLEAWRILSEIISANPILGLGFANYYWYTPLFPIMGYAVKFNSHNNYVDIVAQTGLAGLACFLWFAAACGLLGWRVCRRAAPGFSRAYAASALGGLVGTLIAGMLGDWIVPFVYNVGFAGFGASVLAWIFLGGLIGLDRMTGHDVAHGAADASVR
jgi:O-antigen ligase